MRARLVLIFAHRMHAIPELGQPIGDFRKRRAVLLPLQVEPGAGQVEARIGDAIQGIGQALYKPYARGTVHAIQE